MFKRREIISTIIAVLVVFLIFGSGAFSTLYTDYLWFLNLGFEGIFTRTLVARLLVLLIGFAILFLIPAFNLWIASKMHKETKDTFGAIMVAVAALSVMGAVAFSGAWLDFLKFLNMEAFGIVDPIFGMDASFYVFALPALQSLWNILFASILIAGVATAFFYMKENLSSFFSSQDMDPNTGMKYVNPKAKSFKMEKSMLKHLSILGSLIFLMLSIRHILSRYSLLYSRQGIVVGAGYVDVNIVAPVLVVLSVIAISISLFLIYNSVFTPKVSKKRMKRVVPYALGTYVLLLILLLGIVPSFYQSLQVEPNELTMEREYIGHNINFTRFAFGIDEIREIDYDPEELEWDSIEQSQDTIDNIRILDYRPVLQTYRQTQEIRLQYDLSGIDIDRYDIAGNYTQVMLSARELNQDMLPENAQTWVNKRLVYTHGFGTVMSPVSRVDSEGLPEYLIRDIPPRYSVEDPSIMMDNPRIYYGEKTDEYVLTNTNTREFDYPRAGSTVYYDYTGSGGVEIANNFNRAMMALRFGDIRLLLSSEIEDESRIMFDRNIDERTRKILPFLEFDEDPYIVIADGQLFWIQDAYTTTSRFPYSESFGNKNYIRNSVKVVVDAYDGSVDFYMAEPDDPIVNTYENIFPGTFKDFDEMPDALRDHVRYPEDLFSTQSAILRTYHMKDPDTFYNREDAWEIPYEIYGTGRNIIMEPYYVTMDLPRVEGGTEFVMMLPFTPLRRDNMISWLAARADGDAYGELVLYSLPPDRLIYGPSQVEARIDQNTEISEQLTLWGQQGSRVTRGNLLVIPLESGFIYVEPIYLQADQGEIPELRRVIASDGVSVAMGMDLDDALRRLFVEAEIDDVPEDILDDVDEIPDEDLIDMIDVDDSLLDEARGHYERMMEAMREGDWEAFGKSFDELGELLD